MEFLLQKVNKSLDIYHKNTYNIIVDIKKEQKMHIYNTRTNFSLNEPFLYSECPQPHLESAIKCEFAQYLHCSPLHIEVEFLYGVNLKDGRGALLKGITFEEDDIKDVDIKQLINNIDIHTKVANYVKASGIKVEANV